MGSIYSFVGPKTMLPRKPGTWETFDVTLAGRRITVVRDGVKTIDSQEIPGPTGGALDSNEAEPGPFISGRPYRRSALSQRNDPGPQAVGCRVGVVGLLAYACFGAVP